MSSVRRGVILGLGAVALLVTSSCGAGEVVPATNRYANEVEGVRAGWPDGWQRVEEPLATFTGGAVDLVVLATFDPPSSKDLGCAQDAPGAITAMGSGDAFFRLQTMDRFVVDRPAPARPPSFFRAAESIDHAGGCKPPGVVAIHVPFEEDGRLYDAELRARSPLDNRRRAEVETIWANLQIEPIHTGRVSADAGRKYWHEISTHCGITNTTFDGRQWVADPPLVRDGVGPPPGWQNPTAIGTIRLERRDLAVFESRDRERSARFRPRAAGDPPLRFCE